MTSIMMWVRNDGITMLSDGVAYDADGIVRQIHQKQLLEPTWGGVVAASGAGSTLMYLQIFFQLAPRDPPQGFDELLEHLPDAARFVKEQLELGDAQHTANEFIWLIGGYSDERQRYEGYQLATVGWDDYEAFSLMPISAYAKPEASEEALREQGIDPREPFTEHPATFGLKLMLAQRKSPMPLHHGRDLMGYGVGGICQLTQFQKDNLSSQIVLRWHDEIGKPIDPEAGFSYTTLSQPANDDEVSQGAGA